MSLFPHEFESEHLRYERLHPETVDPFELYEHARAGAAGMADVTEHLSWEPYSHPKAAFDRVAGAGEAFDDGDEAVYVVRPTAGDRAGEFAGCTGIRPQWNRRRAAIWLWLRPPFWGEGYAAERAERLCELALERLDLAVVAVEHTTENDRARRAIEGYVDRLGGEREGRIRNDTTIDGEPRDVVRYSIERAAWAAATE